MTAAAAAAVAVPPTTTTEATTTITTAPTTTAPTTTAPTTTAPPTSNRTTTQPARHTTTVTPLRRSPSAAGRATPTHVVSFGQGCPITAVALLLPQRGAVVVGPIESAAGGTASGSLSYPGDGSIVTGSAVAVHEGACTKHGPARSTVKLGSLSLFGGAVTASHVELDVGNAYSSVVAGLTVAGTRVAAREGAHVAIGSWGSLVTGTKTWTPAGGTAATVSALMVHLRQQHAGLPAGTTVVVAVAGVPAAAARAGGPAALRRKRKHAAEHAPLKVTPPLAGRHFVFPVAGASDYIDTYGAFRSDVPGNWHHGDDIFAPLGTPVVAVATGTINRVGWERLGGWRLWVRDNGRDEFYYAHLSGYTPADLRSKRVTAGEVIGFIGNTGDAFTTSPHLHFEVHPHQLLRLGYDGAVDPTTYLDHWRHAGRVIPPRPAHPPLPTQPLLRREASYDFRELLAARHLIPHPPKASSRPRIPTPPGANGTPVGPRPRYVAAPRRSGGTGHSGLTIALLAGLGSLALCALIVSAESTRRRRGRSPAEPDPAANQGVDGDG